MQASRFGALSGAERGGGGVPVHEAHLVVVVLGDGDLLGGGGHELAGEAGGGEGEAVHVLAGHGVHVARLAQCRTLRLCLTGRLPVAEHDAGSVDGLPG